MESTTNAFIDVDLAGESDMDTYGAAFEAMEARKRYEQVTSTSKKR